MSPCCRTRQAFVFAYTVALLEQHNITYVIGDGSLIGALRHGGMNPCDSDEEIFVFFRDYYANANSSAPGGDRARFLAAMAQAKEEQEVKVMTFGNIVVFKDKYNFLVGGKKVKLGSGMGTLRVDVYPYHAGGDGPLVRFILLCYSFSVLYASTERYYRTRC